MDPYTRGNFSNMWDSLLIPSGQNFKKNTPVTCSFMVSGIDVSTPVVESSDLPKHIRFFIYMVNIPGNIPDQVMNLWLG